MNLGLEAGGAGLCSGLGGGGGGGGNDPRNALNFLGELGAGRRWGWGWAEIGGLGG